jgi:hypothetical protein
MKSLKPIVPFCLTSLILLSVVAQEPEKAKPRVFITDSQSWEIAGGFAATGGTASGIVRGGARPQTAEIIKTFGEKCPDVTVTMKSDNADYIILLDREGGKALYLKDSKFAVFKKDGDSIKAGSTRTIGGAVKDACSALMKDWRPASDKAEQGKSK